MSFAKAFAVCREMVVARGYDVVEVNPDDLYIHTNQAWVCIDRTPKLNNELIKQYYRMFKDHGVRSAVIVHGDTVTSSVHAIIENLDMTIELFCIHDMQYNILHHALVPRHTKIGTMKSNHLKYPVMNRSDAVARFMGYRHGDVVRIDRSDGTVYFRFVR